ncbi:hypothetical protein N9046_08375 [Akkermansiaceae bacterium]|nr:hypothetical protein [Akkermansiaceae bacterium]MDA7617454.1 hypothetical protein [Akkermansiaceae bacterium]MDA7635750.1 hypothetical protein [Akkermansiaceae bacterium]MDA7673878.1 hypothetical protein [Akkermansiaceae bacterium]MDB4362405.1 hypothetical protein [Akkermansiaceae bacterium]
MKRDASTPLGNHFRRASMQATPQDGEMKEMPLDGLPEERLRKEISLPSASIEADCSMAEGEPSPIRLLEPMEGFALPKKSEGVPKLVPQNPKIDNPDPLAMPDPLQQSGPRRGAEPNVPLSPAPDPYPNLVPPSQSVDDRQLVLRAIFGVAHDLNRDEILKRASELAGIVSVKLLGRAERAAFSVLRDGIQELGHSTNLEVVSKEASVELIHGEATTLVVFYVGEYRPGVREILTIVAREFSQID